jgi:glycosyltransferase involved in cell wall biosynthesis
VVQVPLGADDDLPAPPAREDARRRLAVRGPLLLTVGAIFNRRCLPVLLRATSRLVRRHPTLALEVVGENRTVPPLDLPRAVRALDLQDHVRLAGFVSEEGLADRYAAADVAVFLSEYEGFGLPVLEAMRRGVPVACSDRGALAEVAGDAALLFDPGDQQAVTSAIRRLLRDRELRAELVRRGRARVARFSWRRTAELTLDSYRRALSGPRL